MTDTVWELLAVRDKPWANCCEKDLQKKRDWNCIRNGASSWTRSGEGCSWSICYGAIIRRWITSTRVLLLLQSWLGLWRRGRPSRKCSALALLLHALGVDPMAGKTAWHPFCELVCVFVSIFIGNFLKFYRPYV